MFEPAIFANGDLARSMATQAAHLSERVRGAAAGAKIAAAAAAAAPNPALTPPLASRATRQAIELTPDNPRAHLASAISLGRLGACRGRAAGAVPTGRR